MKFSEKIYLENNQDVRLAVEQGVFTSGWDHYKKYGIHEGRVASEGDLLGGEKKISSRAARITKYLNLDALGLEIGPSHNPLLPKSAGFKVDVLDHLSQADLKQKYQGHLGVQIENIEPVDYIWSGEPISELTGQDRYDWVLASHVLEHIPDVITFINEIEKILKPEGLLALALPDKRRCFDYYNSITATGDVLDAFYQKRVAPSVGQIFNHFANAVSQGGNLSWQQSRRKEMRFVHTFGEVKNAMNSVLESSAYVDIHCWRFTPESFELLIDDLYQLKLSGLVLFERPVNAGAEFYATLAKGRKPMNNDRISRLSEMYSALSREYV